MGPNYWEMLHLARTAEAGGGGGEVAENSWWDKVGRGRGGVNRIGKDL
jgi:hypothetical protein